AFPFMNAGISFPDSRATTALAIRWQKQRFALNVICFNAECNRPNASSAGLDMFCVSAPSFSRHSYAQELSRFADAVFDAARRDVHVAVLVDVQMGAPCALAIIVVAFVRLLLFEMRPTLTVGTDTYYAERCGDSGHGLLSLRCMPSATA